MNALRSDIVAESSRHGIHDTSAGLGEPRTLARGYIDDTARPRPQWVAGTIFSGVALLLYWIVFFAYTLGMLAVVEQAALGHAESRFLFIDVTAFADKSGVGIGWSGGLAWLIVPLIIVAITFLLTSRAWRLLPRSAH
ncbi:hypothetical protein ABCS02_25035 [Microbacterium sp. X-17]|uniref:hypothetical protein n=1 Tax=Microbacterium sp. X-17 TaxID=3144404 RepID=UPI0031F5013B